MATKPYPSPLQIQRVQHHTSCRTEHGFSRDSLFSDSSDTRATLAHASRTMRDRAAGSSLSIPTTRHSDIRWDVVPTDAVLDEARIALSDAVTMPDTTSVIALHDEGTPARVSSRSTSISQAVTNAAAGTSAEVVRDVSVGALGIGSQRVTAVVPTSDTGTRSGFWVRPPSTAALVGYYGGDVQDFRRTYVDSVLTDISDRSHYITESISYAARQAGLSATGKVFMGADAVLGAVEVAHAPPGLKTRVAFEQGAEVIGGAVIGFGAGVTSGAISTALSLNPVAGAVTGVTIGIMANAAAKPYLKLFGDVLDNKYEQYFVNQP